MTLDGSAGFHTLGDGLGVRTLLEDGPHEPLELLEVAPDLATSPTVEQAIRSRAARIAELRGQPCALVRRVERATSALRIVTQVPRGVRLSAILMHLERRPEDLPGMSVVELAAAVTAPLAAIHRLPGGIGHGALSPAHVVVLPNGSAVLTDCVFGVALGTLARTREQFWRDFGLALPAGFGVPCFDQHADVLQLALVVLALCIRRPVRAEEYPRALPDLVQRATSETQDRRANPALRLWLTRALQLDGRSTFMSAVDAGRALGDIAAASNDRRAAVRAVHALVRRVLAQPPAASPVLAV